jgi:nickel/cobalt transporter (NiCoT) family protein
MNVAYGWSAARPARRLFYNVIVTAVSVAVALVIGTIQLAGVATARFGLRGAIWDRVASVDMDQVGYALVALFVLTWCLAVAAWRFGRVEERLALPTDP